MTVDMWDMQARRVMLTGNDQNRLREIFIRGIIGSANRGRSEAKSYNGSGRQGPNGLHVQQTQQKTKTANKVTDTTILSNQFQILSKNIQEREASQSSLGGEKRRDSLMDNPRTNLPMMDEEGFQLVRYRKSKNPQFISDDLSLHLPRVSGQQEESAGILLKNHSRSLSPPGGRRGAHEERDKDLSLMEEYANRMTKPKFFKSLENGDFDTEEYDDEIEMDEVDPEDIAVDTMKDRRVKAGDGRIRA